MNYSLNFIPLLCNYSEPNQTICNTFTLIPIWMYAQTCYYTAITEELRDWVTSSLASLYHINSSEICV